MGRVMNPNVARVLREREREREREGERQRERGQKEHLFVLTAYCCRRAVKFSCILCALGCKSRILS